jgi:hypothetical protein
MRVIFTNPGIMDTDAAFTMGVNVKEGSNPIGHFGTGLKFAIATILRGGGTMAIHLGDSERVVLGTERAVLRGKDFDMVTAQHEANDKRAAAYRLGFTTELGRNWEPWMAFRELACNALDEGGSFYSSAGDYAVPPGHTTIVVTGAGIPEAYAKRDGVLAEGVPLYADERFEVRPGACHFIYYRGVRVAKLPRPTTHHYNLLTTIKLTEDRTAASMWEVGYELGRALTQCGDTTVLERALQCGDQYFEHHLELPDSAAMHSEPFKRTAATLRADMSHGLAANPRALKIAEEHRMANLGPEQGITLSDTDRAKLERATAVLLAAGYPVTNYPVTVVESLGPGIYGRAIEGRIFLSRIPFDKGTKEVAATLLEEYAHLHTGYGDMTRGLQTWLFDQIMCGIEQRNGEAL